MTVSELIRYNIKRRDYFIDFSSNLYEDYWFRFEMNLLCTYSAYVISDGKYSSVVLDIDYKEITERKIFLENL